MNIMEKSENSPNRGAHGHATGVLQNFGVSDWVQACFTSLW